jgi:MFS family permease
LYFYVSKKENKMAEKQDPEQDTTGPQASDDPESLETYETYGLNESRLVRRIDLIVLPPVTLVYLLSFLDRSNVGNAKLEGLTDDIKMTGDQYLTGLTLFFIGYVIFEVPCNVVLKLWRPELWLPTLAVIWGTVAALQGVIQNLPGFYLARFFLGVTEAGLFPGIVFYLSMWYKRNERQFRVALFFSAASLAGAFGGILAWGIAHMKGVGGYNGWRWIFILVRKNPKFF